MNVLNHHEVIEVNGGLVPLVYFAAGALYGYAIAKQA